MRALLCAIGIAAMLGACTILPASLSVYKLDINQGNYVTQDQVDKLRVGQTRTEVRAVMGTPLVNDPFHANRWDYMYEFNRQGVTLEHRQFVLFFVDDRLDRWIGDQLPPSPEQVAREGGGDALLDKSLVGAPKTNEETWLMSLLKKLGWGKP